MLSTLKNKAFWLDVLVFTPLIMTAILAMCGVTAPKQYAFGIGGAVLLDITCWFFLWTERK